MRRSFLPILVAVAVSACGGSSKSNTPVAPLPPDPKVAEPTPPKTEDPPQPTEPPAPKGPLELTLPAVQTEVKLVSAGKGKKAPLKLTPKAGSKQPTEIALDFAGSQEAAPEHGGKQNDVAPTVVLLADVETQDVGTDGVSKFQLTVSGVDVRDKPGQKADSAKFKEELTSLVGATISGSVNANGSPGDLMMRVETPNLKTAGSLAFLRMVLMPMWPVLPKEPIAPGAKWTVTSSHKIADKLDVKQVVTYTLVGKKGSAWTIKGTTKVTGDKQTIEGAEFGSISGDGTHEITLTDGALVVAAKQTVATNFTATLTPPADAPAGSKPIDIKFTVSQGNALTPKS